MNTLETMMQPAARKLKVLHVLEATLGGTLRYLNDIIRASNEELYAYGIAYATERADPDLMEMLERARSAGWQTFHVEMVRSVSPKRDLQSTMQLRRIISRFCPDVLHCHSSKAGALGRLGRFLLPKYPKVVYSPHAIAANLGRQYLLIERGFKPLTARFAAVSQSERDELVSLKICDGGKVSIVHPTIDTTHFDVREQLAAKSQLSLAANAELIVGVGRLVEQKDPSSFLQIVCKVARIRPDIKAIWIGEGEMRPQIETAIVALGLSKVVTLAGWQADVRPFIAASSMLLSTSRYESFGYMVAEALAMGRPVVASNVTGTRDIMAGTLTALLYAPGNTNQAADLIHNLLNDRARAEEFGASGREQMERRFNRAAMAEALSDVYQTAIKT